ncbi:MAG: translation elongation factor Ts [Verrucomicrobiota bacterium]|jgi:elongation factor Ts|nr:translation elongation factor Ts [Verrucomicrobiota bacterium]
MPEITPALVGQLRAMTGAGLMNCKKALDETKGDLNAAVDLLRKQGAAAAVKKADRAANEGLIGQAVLSGGQVGALIEVNCETDFVARNDSFKAFVNELAAKAASQPGADLEPDRVGAVAKIGENIQIRRATRLEVQGTGALAAYIHTGGKVGVMVEVGANNAASVNTEEFKQLLRDVTLQIAAASPVSVSRNEVPQDIVDKEREIASQSDALKGKPAAAMESILKGKLNKYFETNCLLEQGFVKNPDLKVEAHLGAVSKQLGDTITIRRFLRFQIGE